MQTIEEILTYGGGLLALAIIIRNGDSVSAIIRSISAGSRSVSATLLAGSSQSTSGSSLLGSIPSGY